MLDDDANMNYLIIKNKEDLQVHADLARKNGASPDVVAQLLSGEKIPGLWPAYCSATPQHDWDNCLVPAQCIEANELYYYAYLQGNTLSEVRKQKILSYHCYLEELDAEALLMS